MNWIQASSVACVKSVPPTAAALTQSTDDAMGSWPPLPLAPMDFSSHLVEVPSKL